MLTCSHMCHLPGVEFDSSGHLLREFRPDVAPVVRAEVTAAHAALGDALDANTLFRWNRASLRNPLADCRSCEAQFISQGLESAAVVTSNSDGIHARIISHRLIKSQPLPTYRTFGMVS